MRVGYVRGTKDLEKSKRVIPGSVVFFQNPDLYLPIFGHPIIKTKGCFIWELIIKNILIYQ